MHIVLQIKIFKIEVKVSKYHKFGTPFQPNGAMNYFYLLFYSV